MNINTPIGFKANLPGASHRTPTIQTHAARRASGEANNELRIPYLGFLPDKARNHFIAMVGEFIGTFLFLFFAFSATQVANASALGADGKTSDGGLGQKPNAQALMYIALAFGFSLAVNAWVFFRISGGLFNPAVTFGMVLIGALSWGRAALLFIAQMAGGLVAAAITSALFPSSLDVATTLNGSTSVVQGLFIEMFLTAELVFTIFMLAAEKHKGTFIAPIGIGLALFIAELSGVYFTGGSLNPARSFGPAVVNRVFPTYHWIYWLGPFLGALLAAGFYHFVKKLEYETANPGQDFNEHEAEDFRFDEESARAADVRRASRVGTNLSTASSPVNTRDAGQVPGYGGRAPLVQQVQPPPVTQPLQQQQQHTLDGGYASADESPSKETFDVASALEAGQGPLFGQPLARSGGL